MGAGANLYVAAGNAFAAIVHVLEATGRFKIVSRPTIFTSNNKKAIIASGQEVPVPVSTLSNVTQNNIINTNNTAAVQSSIEYKKVVLQLEVVPLINSEKEVSLDILQKVDSLVPNGNVNISGNQVPTIDTKYIRTTCFCSERIDHYPGRIDRRSKAEELPRYSLSLAHSTHRRSIP